MFMSMRDVHVNAVCLCPCSMSMFMPTMDSGMGADMDTGMGTDMDTDKNTDADMDTGKNMT